MLEHQEPFKSLKEGNGTDLANRPDLRVTISGGGFVLLQSASEAALDDALKEIGLTIPGPGEACVRGDYALLWLTPAEWLLELPAREIHSLQSTLTERLSRLLAVVTDMSDAFACFEVSGVCAAEVLMSGCSLNLHLHAFPAGRVARTAFADIPTIIRKTEKPDTFRCLIDRSFATHMRAWFVNVSWDQTPSPKR